MVIWQTVLAAAQRLTTARSPYVVAAVMLYLTSLWIVGARWQRFIGAVGGIIGLGRATLATLGGIAAGNLTPSSRLAGEACRITIGRLGGTVTWRQATVATLWDRLSEVPPIIVLAVMGAVALQKLSSRTRSVVLIAALGAVLIGVAIAFRIFRRPEQRVALRRGRLAFDVVGGRAFAAGVGYSSLLWLQDFLRLKCVALAFGVSLSPAQIAMLSIIAMLGGLAPTIGGLGAVEGGLVSGLVALGVDLPTAGAVTALERAISYGLSTAAGTVVIALVGGRSVWSSLPSVRQPATSERSASVPVKIDSM
jgi:glycosyltransferase 2 family protein